MSPKKLTRSRYSLVRPTDCEFIHFDECCNVTLGFDFITSAEREVKDSCSSGTLQSCTLGTSECPGVASALVPGIFALFDVFFQGKK